MRRTLIPRWLQPALFCLLLTSLGAAQTRDRQGLPQSAPQLSGPGASLGVAPQNARLDHMLLLLQPAAAQATALQSFLEEVNNSSSPQFHHWLTPVQFGRQFGPSSDTLTALTTWLVSHGFTIDAIAQGRQWIEFSGTVANVEQAFQTRINSYRVGTMIRYANAAPLSVPVQFASVIQGLVSISG